MSVALKANLRHASCAPWKDELVRATTADEVDLATRKIELLCDG